jgi:hypothetical protein
MSGDDGVKRKRSIFDVLGRTHYQSDDIPSQKKHTQFNPATGWVDLGSGSCVG